MPICLAAIYSGKAMQCSVENNASGILNPGGLIFKDVSVHYRWRMVYFGKYVTKNRENASKTEALSRIIYKRGKPGWKTVVVGYEGTPLEFYMAQHKEYACKFILCLV